jgi:hypothetical protein
LLSAKKTIKVATYLHFSSIVGVREFNKMSYYFQGDHVALEGNCGQSINTSADLQNAYSKFFDLHTAIHPRVRNHNLDLHPRWQKSSIISRESAACLEQSSTLVLTYFRSREQAELVERKMGKEAANQTGEVDTYRHPVIELRLTPDHFAIELILSPYAWLDQQNLIGKLELSHHRTAFRNLLRTLPGDYRFGFWNGVHLGDMNLGVADLLRGGRILDEWMDTFADGQDWLRVGKWYAPEDPALDASNILPEIFNTVKSLHSLYNFVLWSSNNNFSDFYEKRQRHQRRAYA